MAAPPPAGDQIPRPFLLEGPTAGLDGAGNAIGPNYSLYQGEIYNKAATAVVVDTDEFMLEDWSEFGDVLRHKWINGTSSANQTLGQSTTNTYNEANYKPPAQEDFQLTQGRTRLTTGEIYSL
jgi:hypothetical protein